MKQLTAIAAIWLMTVLSVLADTVLTQNGQRLEGALTLRADGVQIGATLVPLKDLREVTRDLKDTSAPQDELARLTADLPARDGGHTRDSVAEAVGALMAGIELVDDRYVDYSMLSAPTLIADDFFNAGVVLGPEVTAWHALDLETIEGMMVIDDIEVGRGQGADILGHPLNALTWLADHRAALGTPLRAGDFAMLGSVVKTVHFNAPATVRIRFDGLGEVAVQFM